MADRSHIEWTDATWNPITGCTKVSEGCRFCYAERLAKRLQAMGVARYANGFQLQLHWDLIDIPRSWRRPRHVFVNSMSDLFHESVPEDFIQAVFQTMRECPQHTFQILTKRSARLRELAPSLEWRQNIWIGVSVESQATTFRIGDLQSVPALVRFISCEPLLGPIDHLPLSGIRWVIVGGESGAHARPMDPSWVRAIRQQCERASVAFFLAVGGHAQASSGAVARR